MISEKFNFNKVTGHNNKAVYTAVLDSGKYLVTRETAIEAPVLHYSVGFVKECLNKGHWVVVTQPFTKQEDGNWIHSSGFLLGTENDEGTNTLALDVMLKSGDWTSRDLVDHLMELVNIALQEEMYNK